MSKLLALLGATAGGYPGRWLGAFVGTLSERCSKHRVSSGGLTV
jgi:hypothetical protein